MSWARAQTMGAATFTAGHSRMMALQSPGVSVIELPAPCRTPELKACPGNSSSVLAPMSSIVFLIALEEPLPISTIVITAAMPMTMPSVVSAARMMLRVRALVAVRKVCWCFMPNLLLPVPARACAR